MELVVQNIGKIEDAKIEINGMTVITGYNGTGKSSLCRSLYSIIDTFSDINQKIFNQRKNSLISTIYNWEENLLDDGLSQESSEKVIQMLMNSIYSIKNFENVDCLSNVISDISEHLGIDFNEKTINILQGKCKDIIEKDKEEYVQFIISRNIKSIFKNQLAHVNYKGKASVIELQDEQKTWNMVFELNELCKYDYKYSTLKKPVYIEPQSVLDKLGVNSYRFNAVRNNNGIESFLIGSNSNNSNLTLEEYQEQQNNLKIINDILRDVTNGHLESNQNNAFVYSENGLSEEIECSNIASGLKPFLIIQRLIENGALGAGRVLIIDEPEVNLHPEWQLAFAKILVLLNSKLDVRVVLSTHSPYFLRAIEYYMEEFNNSNNGKYYITCKKENHLYTLSDVTDNLERIYKTLYTPLEEIN